MCIVLCSFDEVHELSDAYICDKLTGGVRMCEFVSLWVFDAKYMPMFSDIHTRMIPKGVGLAPRDGYLRITCSRKMSISITSAMWLSMSRIEDTTHSYITIQNVPGTAPEEIQVSGAGTQVLRFVAMLFGTQWSLLPACECNPRFLTYCGTSGECFVDYTLRLVPRLLHWYRDRWLNLAHGVRYKR